MSSAKSQTITLRRQATVVERAAAYIRMSTEHQQYSTYNQLTVIKEYAAAHDLALVHTYSDEGISGLRIKNRRGLQALIRAVAGGKPDFGKILVYDISRWGRFQDPDQSAFYEYFCRMNGADVIYCAESFQNDLSPISIFMKSIRRFEAADYSRDLSNKVFLGQCNLARRGHVQGGTPRFGLKHILVRDDGKTTKGLRRRTKKLYGYHIELAPGPKREIRVVKEVFRRYVKLGETITQITAYLNSKSFKPPKGRIWNACSIGFILAEEQYIGTLIYNRCSEKLQGRWKANPTSEWIRKPNAFPAIVDPAIFKKAQERRQREARRFTDEELLAGLRRFLSKHGYITQQAMRRFGGVPPYAAYLRRFGSIVNAYRMIGYEWTSRSGYWRERHRRRRLRTDLLEELAQRFDEMGVEVKTNLTRSRFWIQDVSVWFQLSTRRIASDGRVQWYSNLNYPPPSNFRLIGRLGKDGQSVMDYYLVPRSALPGFPWTLKMTNADDVEAYRLDDLAAVAQRLTNNMKKAQRSYGLMLPRITG